MNSNLEYTFNWETFVSMWYNEVNNYEGESAPVEEFEFDEATAHYTQIAWAQTYAIGCGFVEFYANGWYNNFLVCNYGPGGNVIGQPMYQIGQFEANQCEYGASSNYEDLCNAP
jgi:predicted component of type VI protein secretion system